MTDKKSRKRYAFSYDPLKYIHDLEAIIDKIRLENLYLCKKIEMLKRVIERLKKTSINLYSFKESEKGWKQGIIDKVWVNIEEGESDLCMLMLNLAEEHFIKMYNDNGYVHWLEKEISRLKSEINKLNMLKCV